jgi:4-hydroxy-tetrahydrodipicolinate reductase
MCLSFLEQQVGQYDEMVALHRKNGAFSSNFSLGVNIFFEINEYLAKMKLDHYSIEMRKFTILRN